VLAATLESLRVDADAMRRAAADPMLLATDLAEHLVRRGVPFREAHEIVGRVVAHAIETATPLDRLGRDALRRFHDELDVDPAEFFSVERSLEARDLIGAPARARVEAAVGAARREIEETARELGA
jgi:argininosuccinate lyase